MTPKGRADKPRQTYTCNKPKTKLALLPIDLHKSIYFQVKLCSVYHICNIYFTETPLCDANSVDPDPSFGGGPHVKREH